MFKNKKNLFSSHATNFICEILYWSDKYLIHFGTKLLEPLKIIFLALKKYFMLLRKIFTVVFKTESLKSELL